MLPCMTAQSPRFPLKLLFMPCLPPCFPQVLQQICPPGSRPPDVVENGLQVLSKLDSGTTYDIILMDIHMPEMDGLEATRKICERFPRPEDRPRIVALSADTLQDLHDRCVWVGSEGCCWRVVAGTWMLQGPGCSIRL